MAISFNKIKEDAPELLSLAKLSRVEISKKELDGHRAKVVLVMDFSISMDNTGQYKSGKMQRLAEKVLAVATGFDDDGDIDFFVFDTEAAYLGAIALNDYKGAVDRLTKGRRKGSTNYAAAFRAVRDHFGFPVPQVVVAPQAAPVASAPQAKGFLGGLKKAISSAVEAGTTATATPTYVPATNSPAEIPVFAVFLTDGGPNSRPEAVQALTEVSTAPIFWKFLSIGPENMAFLQKLDDLTERFIDNADYQPIGDVDSISDKELFDLLLVEYPTYLKEARAKGLIV